MVTLLEPTQHEAALSAAGAHERALDESSSPRIQISMLADVRERMVPTPREVVKTQCAANCGEPGEQTGTVSNVFRT
jgi:ArsR family metal-binding transcriptional regulator